jgi:hypothetical protein
MIKRSSLQAIDPFLTPDWRRLRAVQLAETRPLLRCRTCDDDWIRTYRTFLLHRQRNPDSYVSRYRQDNPHLLFASMLHEAKDEDYELLFIIETRLLSGESIDDIAMKLKTSPETVRYFERLFFNVRPYLKSQDWVFRNVLLRAIDAARADKAIREAENDAFSVARKSRTVQPIISPFLDPSIKFFSYLGGPAVCDVMLAGLAADSPVVSKADIASFLEEQFRITIKSRGLQLAKLMPLNVYNATEFLKLSVLLQDVVKDNGGSGNKATTAELQAQMQEMVSISALSVGLEHDEINMADANLVDLADRGGVELDAEELATNGETGAGFSNLDDYNSVFEQRALGVTK